ncbi:MAG: isochorismatase family protein [Chloroflexi bacterium]|nr:isochorismatase family protein [Chloroflexota bacterium]
MRRWEEIYSEDERAVGESKGNRERQAVGKRPALLIIDVNRRCLGTSEAIPTVEKYRAALWAAGWAALPNIQILLKACRSVGVPVVFATGDAVTRHYLDIPPKLTEKRNLNLEAEMMPEEIAPLSTELVIRKTKASAFFLTPLDNCLRDKGIDCLLVGGNATSGCVRASVVDAFSHGYRVFVVEECCYDRLQLSHLVSLFDMNLKYADVITLEESLEQVARMPRPKP